MDSSGKFLNLIRSRKGNTAVIVAIVVGIVMIAGIIFVYVKANEESDKIYKDMEQEIKKLAENPAYGYGVEAPAGNSDVDAQIGPGGKPRPVIYIRPAAKK